VTAMSCASSSLIKEKEIQKKRNIKSRKIDKRKRKMLVSKAFHKKYMEPAPHPQLLIKKRNTKLKKFRSIENKDKEYNIWCIGRVMETNITNELWK